MPYRIELTPAATCDVKGLDRPVAHRILRKLDELAEEPRPPGADKLSGQKVTVYRIRLGDYRILYTIEDQTVTVTVVRVRHRRDVYRNL